MTPEAKKFQNKVTNPTVFWFAMLTKLPTAVFWNLKIKHLDEESCTVTLPYSWRTQNPFQSIYFAALAGAAEMTTGALCQLAMAGKGKFSMLVVDFRAEFFKKANEKITFECNQGAELSNIIDQLQIEESNTLTMISTGTNPAGEEVAKFYVTWSFIKKE